ncbi:uncharacterized protein LOC124437122 [Xenia sp. Carnegie-2017]|uniref:uncharacterized protein LOC124437122 n=1 Tax=Xenia sp. Carnegie-2017 TaxID=2897299 RepID=UPI001F046933|nr:uncharacterized protein LOC124437122 [Xenia sp. Carnegie-2017]
MAVNQNLLGSYIATVRQDKSLLSNHYHEHAFLRDPIMADTVQSILNNGITNFDFDISVRPQTLFEHNNIQNLITKPQTIHGSFQYDIGKTRENGYDGEESLQRTAHIVQKKKQRRKKLQVKTVVIEEQEHYDDTELPETLRNMNVS